MLHQTNLIQFLLNIPEVFLIPVIPLLLLLLLLLLLQLSRFNHVRLCVAP